jgi:hypothetical protein
VIASGARPYDRSTPSEQVKIEAGLPPFHEISDDFTDHRSELEAMPRARTDDQHFRPFGMPIDPEGPSGALV